LRIPLGNLAVLNEYIHALHFQQFAANLFQGTNLSESRVFVLTAFCIVLSELELDTSSNSTGSSSSNQTDLSTGRLPPRDGCWLTDVLMVTTTVRMFDWVHADTSDLREHLSLGLEHVVFFAGLQDGLLVSATASNDSDHATGVTLDCFFVTGWKLDSGLGAVFGLADDGDEGTGASGESTTIVIVLLDIAHGGTFWDSIDREDVSGGDLGLGSAVNVLANVHGLSSDEMLDVLLVLVWVGELNLSERSTTAWVVDEILDDSLHVAFAFDVIGNSELARSDSVECV